MDGFLPQFLAAAWRLIAIIVGLLMFAGFIAWRNAQKAQEAKAQKKERMNPNAEKKQKQRPQGQQKRPSRRQQEAIAAANEPELEEDFEMVSSGGSIFDDDGFFEDEDEESLDDVIAELEDDPLAELYAARAEENRQQQTAYQDEDDEEAVDLASLLSGMAQEPKDYHLIASEPVAVKLVDKKIAVANELLTILRDERDARLMVQIGDVAYRSLDKGSDAKKMFTAIMQELSGKLFSADENPPESAELDGQQPNTMVPKPVDVQVATGGDTQAREMISVLRDQVDEHLIIQIGNTGYRSLVGQEKARNGFAKIMQELAQSVTQPDDNPPVPPKKQVREMNPQKPKRPLPKFGDPILSADGIDADAPLPGDIRLPKMDELPDSYEVGRFGRVKVKKISQQDKVNPLNIADAIEEYLQYKISNTPEFQNRGIHIRAAFGGGVKIEVDGATYEFVDEVADPAAQAFIKSAIDEWQERH